MGENHMSCLTVSVPGLAESCWHFLSAEHARPRATLNSFSVLERLHGEKLNAICFLKMDCMCLLWISVNIYTTVSCSE